MPDGSGKPRVMNIGLIGFGTVGTAVYQILQQNREELRLQTRVDLRVKRIVVRDLTKPRPVAVAEGLLTDNPQDVLADPEIDIVVEMVGGAHLKPVLLQALASGKAVITANKELIADHGPELFRTAEACDVDLLFEGSVGGGIPILRPLRETLAAGRIRRIMGIVNGTTNYILTQMSREGKSFAAALAEAQLAGYAEADPTADVDGHDAARKLAILATIAFHSRVTTADVYAEGIRRITPADIAYGQQRGWALKLLAIAAQEGEQYEARVHPAFIPATHPLASVNDAFNAIYVHGEEVGETMFYGRGAGGMPTASAVIGDIVEAAKNRRRGVSFSEVQQYNDWSRKEQVRVLSRYYLRVALTQPAAEPAARTLALVGAGAAGEGSQFADGQTSARQAVEHLLPTYGIPVAYLSEYRRPDGTGDLVVETGLTTEGALHTMREVLHGVPGVAAITNIIRILN
ncbi:MAG: homoserine dehydrogenase [Firmicutes bacterium]|nr:homoserine dehydrogenase [Bacillota bacterium]